MTELRCQGLSADWLNGWLAAVGAVVRCPSLRLSWTAEDHTPIAVLHSSGNPLEDLKNALPTVAEVYQLVIATEPFQLSSTMAPMKRKVALNVFSERAVVSRGNQDASLSSTLTDLIANDEAAHSPFDPPVPLGLTLHDRLVKCVTDISEGSQDLLQQTLLGTGERFSGNGLGFDYRRLPASTEGGDLRVDPVVEVLAFWGIQLFPTRGDGMRQRTRGWRTQPSRRHSFTWPTWEEPLDAGAVDYLLDRWYIDSGDPQHYGITAAFGTVPYKPRGSSDIRRAYSAERVSLNRKPHAEPRT